MSDQREEPEELAEEPEELADVQLLTLDATDDPLRLELASDEPPSSGEWVDIHDVLESLTEDELEEGRRLGEAIDVEDDDDSGLSFDISGPLSAAAGRASAVAEAKKLRVALLDCGVPQVSIEVIQGRPSSYGRWNAQFVTASFAHHTVSRYNAKNRTPVLSLIKKGRSDLPGPLANGYGGFDLVARIITLGYANHPGSGGPITVPSGVAKPKSYTIPKDSARRYAFGWEFEGGLSDADWNRTYTNAATKKKMTFHEFMARCLNGTQQMYDLPLSAHLEHSTWTSRKIDRRGYTRARAIAQMKKYR